MFNHTFYSRVEQIQIFHAKILMNTRTGFLTGKLANNLYTPMVAPVPVEPIEKGKEVQWFDVGKAENFPDQQKRNVQLLVPKDRPDSDSYNRLLEAHRATLKRSKVGSE